MTRGQPESEQGNDALGQKKPKPVPDEVKVKPDAEGHYWRFHKAGIEINQHGQLRTTAK